MNTDSIGYRYTDDELATLRLIMSLDLPLGCAQRVLDEEAYDKAVASLSDAQIITPAGSEAYIDKLTAMLLSEISDSEKCLRVIAQNRVCILFRCSRLYVIDDISSGIHTLTPVGTAAEAAALLADSPERCVLPAEIALLNADGTADASIDADNPSSLLAAIDHPAESALRFRASHALRYRTRRSPKSRSAHRRNRHPRQFPADARLIFSHDYLDKRRIWRRKIHRGGSPCRNVARLNDIRRGRSRQCRTRKLSRMSIRRDIRGLPAVARILLPPAGRYPQKVCRPRHSAYDIAAHFVI